MGTLTTIGIHDDLSSGQSGISMRSTDYELTGRIHEVFDIIMEEGKHLLTMYLRLHTRDEDVDDVFPDLCQHTLIIIVELIMLGRNHDRVDAQRCAVVIILYGYLTLCIRTQVSHHLTLLANLSQCLHQTVREIQCYRHIILCLVGSITEHHTLIAGALLLLVLTIHTTVDITALLVDGCQHTTGVAVKLIFTLRITDLLNRLTGDGIEIDIHLTTHLTHDHHLTRSDEGLYGATRLIIVC